VDKKIYVSLIVLTVFAAGHWTHYFEKTKVVRVKALTVKSRASSNLPGKVSAKLQQAKEHTAQKETALENEIMKVPEDHLKNKIAELQEFPKLNELRKQASAHPHDTPVVLLDYARKTGEVMEELKSSEDNSQKIENAKAFAQVLKSCASNPEVVPSVQAFCWVSLKNLAQQQNTLDVTDELASAQQGSTLAAAELVLAVSSLSPSTP
jgi:hypothetical protein